MVLSFGINLPLPEITSLICVAGNTAVNIRPGRAGRVVVVWPAVNCNDGVGKFAAGWPTATFRRLENRFYICQKLRKHLPAVNLEVLASLC